MSGQIDFGQPVYLNDARIADASTWAEVAEAVSRVSGINFNGKSIQLYASEGPLGFYVTLRFESNRSLRFSSNSGRVAKVVEI
jgi:hypothetical protein